MSKKEELLINAAKIIYKEGIQKLTIDYLAEVSNITKGGVLYHFKNKNNLLLQMNEMAIEKFEKLWEKFKKEISGPARYTRAYALATIHFLKNRETALLPAVFISSLEYETSFHLWEKTSKKWDCIFLNDSGDEEKILQLRLICDGIWFSILYTPNETLYKKIEKTVLNFCEELEKGED